MHRVAILFSLLCLGFTAESAWSQAEAPEVKVRLERDAVIRGEQVLLIVEVLGPQAADCALAELPALAGLTVEEITGPEMFMQPSEGEGADSRTPMLGARFEVKLLAREAGTFTIPPLKVKVQQDRPFLGPPLTLVVRESAAPSSSWAQLTVVPAKARVYCFERLVIRVTLRIRGEKFKAVEAAQDKERLTLPWLAGEPTFASPRVKAPEKDQASRAIPTGREMAALPFTFQYVSEAGATLCLHTAELSYLPTRPGLFAFGPSLYTVPLSREEVVVCESAPFHVEVMPLPETGRPRSATNGVGDFVVDFQAHPLDVQVGEAIRLTFSVEGEGNLEFLELPGFHELESGFHLYGREEGGDENRRWQTIHLAPRTIHDREIPGLAFAYFEPAAGSYRTVAWGPQEITVRAGPVKAVGDADPSQGQGSLKEIETIALRWPERLGFRLAKQVLFICLTLSLCLVFFAWFIFRRKGPGAAAQQKARAGRAFKVFQAGLARAGQGDGLARLVGRYLSDRFGLLLGEVLAGAPGKDLEAKGVPQELAREMESFFRDLDQARFSPEEAGHGMENRSDRAAALVRRLEESGP